jgi:DNA-binding MarR family transcriptional regulator
MPGTSQSQDVDKSHIMLGLLDSVERDGGQSQRRIAAELGIALGLVNAYLKRCITKGLVKVNEAPARRYAYYLTPKGFAEKSRLTVEYLSYSFSFFRQARSDCSALLRGAVEAGLTRLVLAGKSDLAEVAAICALESGARIVAIVDPSAKEDRALGVPLLRSFDEVEAAFDAIVITDLLTAYKTTNAAIERFGRDRVLIPTLLHVRNGVKTKEPV